MKELKDIILKKGDIVYYTSNYGENSILSVDGLDGYLLKEVEDNGWVVTKIKRPIQYKTIYEAPKEILDKEEKEYLEAVIRPFRNRQIYITKISQYEDSNAFIQIKVNCGNIDLPLFDKGTMYKGMELNKEYTLDELGLFKE